MSARPSLLPVRFMLRLFAARRLALVVLVAAAASACQRSAPDFTASIAGQPGWTEDGLKRQAEALGQAYDRKPGEKALSLRYAQVLRQLGQHGQAVAVLQRASVANLNDAEVAAAYGKALAEVGRFREASEVLARAHMPDRPDWRILSAQGAAADQMGDHARAQEFYNNALQVSPGEPSVLANLGLSYALTKRLPEAEKVLRQAASHPRADDRVRANLALVLSLAGKGEGTAASPPPAAAGAPAAGTKAAKSSRPTATVNPALRPGQTNTWAEIAQAEVARQQKN
ncbi:MAG TPA: tetratricopeptide repeat protein [Beijerinckiaceae bacterium]|nr:tetratricopeptide repeat protein [Beijerinckiaceae bacterium]